MKNIFTFLFSSLFCLSIQAQITITADAFPREATFIDTFLISSLSLDDLPNLGQNQTWDYSFLTLDGLGTRSHSAAAEDSLFADAYSAYSVNLDFQGFPIPVQIFEEFTETSWGNIGRISEDVTYSIAAITGGATDSLRFPAHTQRFNDVLDFLNFPLSFGSEWSASNTEITPFELTVAAFGLNQTPGLNKKDVSERREVVGEGTITLPAVPGYPSTAMDVLCIKSVTTITDSVFLGGAPAPPAILAAFGIVQGQTFVDSAYLFYKPNFANPVARIGAVSGGVGFRPQASGTISSTNDLIIKSARSFPNPVAAGQSWTIQAEDPLGNSNLEVIDLTGRVVFTTQLTAGESHVMTLRLPASLKTGTYFYRLQNIAENTVYTGRVQVKK